MSFKSSVLLASLINLRRKVSLKYQYCIDISGYVLFSSRVIISFIFLCFIFPRDGCDNGPHHFAICVKFTTVASNLKRERLCKSGGGLPNGNDFISIQLLAKIKGWWYQWNVCLLMLRHRTQPTVIICIFLSVELNTIPKAKSDARRTRFLINNDDSDWMTYSVRLKGWFV